MSSGRLATFVVDLLKNRDKQLWQPWRRTTPSLECMVSHRHRLGRLRLHVIAIVEQRQRKSLCSHNQCKFRRMASPGTHGVGFELRVQGHGLMFIVRVEGFYGLGSLGFKNQGLGVFHHRHGCQSLLSGPERVPLDPWFTDPWFRVYGQWMQA